jgi:formylglycine-generating enzyme
LFGFGTGLSTQLPAIPVVYKAKMTLQRCSGAERLGAVRSPGPGRARGNPGTWRISLSVTALAGVALGACSSAGGSADPAPFASAGTGGGSNTGAAAGSGAVLAAPGGSMNAPAAPDDLLGSPGGLIEPAPEPPAPALAFPEAPSCEGGAPDACQGSSCCARKPVATAAEAMTVTDNVSVILSDYALDQFEVTVGRFRTFLAAYDDWRDAANPRSGDGAHPETPGSGWDRDPTWEVNLPDSAAVMRVGLNCNASQQTWTDAPSSNELKPINCVSWYEAFAFCVWDEGRLPTEAEWQYAAVGGAQARAFAWGNTPLAPSFASYACLVAGTGSSCTADDIPDVGTHPDGDGRYNQSDLTGSVYEWTLDWYGPYPELMRHDYANTDTGTQRVLRGGAWNSTTAQAMGAADRSFRREPTFRSTATGVRCARRAEIELH